MGREYGSRKSGMWRGELVKRVIGSLWIRGGGTITLGGEGRNAVMRNEFA